MITPFLVISTKFGRDSKLYERHFQEIYDRNVSCKILQSVISEQWKRAGPITQRSEDQNLALLTFFRFFFGCGIAINVVCKTFEL